MVHRIHLKIGVLMQNNIQMCNEEEIFYFLDFPGSIDPLDKLYAENRNHFCGQGNYNNGSSDSLELWYTNAE